MKGALAWEVLQSGLGPALTFSITHFAESGPRFLQLSPCLQPHLSRRRPPVNAPFVTKPRAPFMERQSVHNALFLVPCLPTLHFL